MLHENNPTSFRLSTVVFKKQLIQPIVTVLNFWATILPQT